MRQKKALSGKEAGGFDRRGRGLAFWTALSNGPGLTLLSQEKIESVYHTSKLQAASAAERQSSPPVCLLIT